MCVVSVVIPCYNAELYIADAIESALRQTYRPLEVVVVDDGSMDGSLDVIRSFGSSVRVATGPNRGSAAARNRGAALARGEVFQFLDADDILHSTKVERQMECMLLNTESFVFCNASVIDYQTGAPLGVWGQSDVSISDPVIYVLRSVIQTAAPLHWRQHFVAAGGFRREMVPGEDPDLHLRLACRGLAFVHIDEALYTTRRVNDGLSSRLEAVGVLRWYESAVQAWEQLSRDRMLNEARSRAFAGFLAKTARAAIRCGETALAADCLKTARRMHPDGGISDAYSLGARIAVQLLGFAATERLVGWKRRLLR